ncbi:dTMP kinase [Candidatus Woesearchaeota archaeon]|nr:dTMP kinase [Candidatus Woesearchaeota archaeon]
MKGKFITFEGGEGAGKGTQIKLLKEELEKKGYNVIVTKEPGDTEAGRKIREILLSPETKNLCSESETLLFLADRAQHVSELIIPALEQGKIVLSDRYTDSTDAYQGFGRGMDRTILRKMQDFATQGLKPDLTIVLDVKPEEGLKRSTTKEFGKKDRIEQEKIEFHQKLLEGFKQIAEEEPDRVKVITPGTVENVHADIMKHVDNIL